MEWLPVTHTLSPRKIIARTLAVLRRRDCVAWAALSSVCAWTAEVATASWLHDGHFASWPELAQFAALALLAYPLCAFTNFGAAGVAFFATATGDVRSRLRALARAVLGPRALTTTLATAALVMLGGSVGLAIGAGIGILRAAGTDPGWATGIGFSIALLGAQALCCEVAPSLALDARKSATASAELLPRTWADRGRAVAAHLTLAPVVPAAPALFHYLRPILARWWVVPEWVVGGLWVAGAVAVYSVLGAALTLQRRDRPLSGEIVAKIIE